MKRGYGRHVHRVPGVAPRTGAWIETQVSCNRFSTWLVAPRAGDSPRVHHVSSPQERRWTGALALGRDRSLVGVALARKGVMEAWTMLPVSKNLGYVNSQRAGKLLRAK